MPAEASTWPSEAEIFGDDLEDRSLLQPELPFSDENFIGPASVDDAPGSLVEDDVDSAESFFASISGDGGSDYDSDSSSPADDDVVSEQHRLSVRRLMRNVDGQAILDDTDPLEEIIVIPGGSHWGLL